MGMGHDLDALLEADFLGRAQTLTLEQAELRLHRALMSHREASGNRDKDPQVSAYLDTLGYRSIAYDAAGLTATMVRTFANCEYEIVGAHMQLMRSMVAGEYEPCVQPLFEVLRQLSPTSDT